MNSLAWAWFWGWNGIAIGVGILAGAVWLLEPAWLDKLIPRVHWFAGIVAICAFAFSVAFDLGFAKAKLTCDEAALRAQIATLTADLAAAKEQVERSTVHTKEINAEAGANGHEVEQINVEVAKRAPAERCALSAADAQRLRNIKPRR